MKIGVLSDTHGQVDRTTAAIHLLRERGVELILHCGDIDSPATVRLFTDVPTHFVFGNWDLRSSLEACQQVCQKMKGRRQTLPAGPALLTTKAQRSHKETQRRR
ncbi:MAG: metallophosphoesterase family protein [Zavarzinella sp.]|nr:metallophosphoesterase family protein [Zavarzinella sp.]